MWPMVSWQTIGSFLISAAILLLLLFEYLTLDEFRGLYISSFFFRTILAYHKQIICSLIEITFIVKIEFYVLFATNPCFENANCILSNKIHIHHQSIYLLKCYIRLLLFPVLKFQINYIHQSNLSASRN